MQPPKLIAFHGDKKIKAKYLDRVRQHRKADQIIKGYHWRDGKGCAVGCTIHGFGHAAYESALGIPKVLVHIKSEIFQSLPDGEAVAWPEEFLKAIPVGSDLSMIWPRFAHRLLVDGECGVIKFAKTPLSKKSIEETAHLYARWIEGSKPGMKEWILRESFVSDVAQKPPISYSNLCAWSVAVHAAEAEIRTCEIYYTSHAASASACAAAAYSDRLSPSDVLRQTAFVRQSVKLLELLREAPIVE